MGGLIDQCKKSPQGNSQLKGTSAGDEDEKVKLEKIDKGINELKIKLKRAESNLSSIQEQIELSASNRQQCFLREQKNEIENEVKKTQQLMKLKQSERALIKI